MYWIPLSPESLSGDMEGPQVDALHTVGLHPSRETCLGTLPLAAGLLFVPGVDTTSSLNTEEKGPGEGFRIRNVPEHPCPLIRVYIWCVGVGRRGKIWFFLTRILNDVLHLGGLGKCEGLCPRGLWVPLSFSVKEARGSLLFRLGVWEVTLY